MANATSTTGTGAAAGRLSDGTPDADNTIEALLRQRVQYEQWLARLDSAVENAPSGVRERVRSDYEGRLHRVIDELRGHSAAIIQELEHHRSVESRLNGERQKAEEALAEAEVRHIVGEYADDEWERLSGDSESRLEGLRSELRSVGAEIARLAEVQALIAAPARGAERSAATATAAAPVPTPVPVAAPQAATLEPPMQLEIAEPTPASVVPTPTPVAQSAAPAPTPVRPLERQPEPVATGTPPAMDELAFLKSVSDDERRPAASPRRSGSGVGAPAGASAGASVKPNEPAPVASAPATPAPPTPGASTAGGAKTAGMAKTLKCNECGTFNRPTEWYCERCGAELAAL